MVAEVLDSSVEVMDALDAVILDVMARLLVGLRHICVLDVYYEEYWMLSC